MAYLALVTTNPVLSSGNQKSKIYQNRGSSRTVQPDFLDLNSLLFQLPSDDVDEVAQLNVDGGEVSPAVNVDDLAHEVV